MNNALSQYIEAARQRGHSEAQIKHDMTAAGWSETVVESGLKGEEPLVVPPPPPPPAAASAARPGQSPGQVSPAPVVQSLTTRGLEYTIMFISMGVAALSLGAILHSIVNTTFGAADSWLYSSSDASFSGSALLVSLPIFAILFIRLKRAEQADPNLARLDLSRKRMVQLTLIVTFLLGLGNIIYFIYSLMNPSATDAYNISGSPSSASVLGNFVHLLISIAIAGGIFTYYWIDEHRPR